MTSVTSVEKLHYKNNKSSHLAEAVIFPKH